MNPSETKKFYGSVTVSERGQIVIPVEARRDFGINPGDKLLVLGDLEQGIALTTLRLLERNVGGALALLRDAGQQDAGHDDAGQHMEGEEGGSDSDAGAS